MTNPFEQGQQAAPQQQIPAAAANPFAANVPTQPAAAPNPFSSPAQQAPQAYAQPTQQQTPYAPQAYPANYPVPQQPAAPAFGALSAAAPPPPSGDGKGAKFENLYGRLLMFFPHSFERKVKNADFWTAEERAAVQAGQPAPMSEQITATVVALNDHQGGMSPVQWGGDPSTNRPHTESANLPYVRKGMWVSQSKVIAQLMPHLPQAPGGAPGVVVGRILKNGTERNSAWYIASDVSQQEMDLAQAYLDLVKQGRYPHPLAA